MTGPILLVEDDADDAALTLRALRKNRIGNEFVHVGDGLDAWDFLLGSGRFTDRGPRRPALVLLDLKLPRLDGLGLLQRIRSDPSARRIPVVVLSSSREESDVGRCYDLGVNSYVRKPGDFAQFIEAVQALGTYWLLVNEPPPDGVG